MSNKTPKQELNAHNLSSIDAYILVVVEVVVVLVIV